MFQMKKGENQTQAFNTGTVGNILYFNLTCYPAFMAFKWTYF